MNIESDSDDEVFIGAVTKKEIIKQLKFQNLLTEENLKPLTNYSDTDPLDQDLVLFYDAKIKENGHQLKDPSIIVEDLLDETCQYSILNGTTSAQTESVLQQMRDILEVPNYNKPKTEEDQCQNVNKSLYWSEFERSLIKSTPLKDRVYALKNSGFAGNSNTARASSFNLPSPIKNHLPNVLFSNKEDSATTVESEKETSVNDSTNIIPEHFYILDQEDKNDSEKELSSMHVTERKPYKEDRSMMLTIDNKEISESEYFQLKLLEDENDMNSVNSIEDQNMINVSKCTDSLNDIDKPEMTDIKPVDSSLFGNFINFFTPVKSSNASSTQEDDENKLLDWNKQKVLPPGYNSPMKINTSAKLTLIRSENEGEIPKISNEELDDNNKTKDSCIIADTPCKPEKGFFKSLRKKIDKISTPLKFFETNSAPEETKLTNKTLEHSKKENSKINMSLEKNDEKINTSSKNHQITLEDSHTNASEINHSSTTEFNKSEKNKSIRSLINEAEVNAPSKFFENISIKEETRSNISKAETIVNKTDTEDTKCNILEEELHNNTSQVRMDTTKNSTTLDINKTENMSYKEEIQSNVSHAENQTKNSTFGLNKTEDSKCNESLIRKVYSPAKYFENISFQEEVQNITTELVTTVGLHKTNDKKCEISLQKDDDFEEEEKQNKTLEAEMNTAQNTSIIELNETESSKFDFCHKKDDQINNSYQEDKNNISNTEINKTKNSSIIGLNQTASNKCNTSQRTPLKYFVNVSSQEEIENNVSKIETNTVGLNKTNDSKCDNSFRRVENKNVSQNLVRNEVDKMKTPAKYLKNISFQEGKHNNTSKTEMSTSGLDTTENTQFDDSLKTDVDSNSTPAKYFENIFLQEENKRISLKNVSLNTTEDIKFVESVRNEVDKMKSPAKYFANISFQKEKHNTSKTEMSTAGLDTTENTQFDDSLKTDVDSNSKPAKYFEDIFLQEENKRISLKTVSLNTAEDIKFVESARNKVDKMKTPTKYFENISFQEEKHNNTSKTEMSTAGLDTTENTQFGDSLKTDVDSNSTPAKYFEDIFLQEENKRISLKTVSLNTTEDIKFVESARNEVDKMKTPTKYFENISFQEEKHNNTSKTEMSTAELDTTENTQFDDSLKTDVDSNSTPAKYFEDIFLQEKNKRISQNTVSLNTTEDIKFVESARNEVDKMKTPAKYFENISFQEEKYNNTSKTEMTSAGLDTTENTQFDDSFRKHVDSKSTPVKYFEVISFTEEEKHNNSSTTGINTTAGTNYDDSLRKMVNKTYTPVKYLEDISIQDEKYNITSTNEINTVNLNTTEETKFDDSLRNEVSKIDTTGKHFENISFQEDIENDTSHAYMNTVELNTIQDSDEGEMNSFNSVGNRNEELAELSSSLLCYTNEEEDEQIDKKRFSKTERKSGSIATVTSKNSTLRSDVSGTDSMNDTLEEMELLMRFGVNYMKQEKYTPNKTTPITQEETKILQEETKTSQEETKTPHEEKLKTPLRKLDKCTPLKIKPVHTPHLKSTPLNVFKIPTKMSSTKKSPAPSNNFKNIVSPISLYIKNSPKVPLVRNLPKQAAQNISTMKKPSFGIENNQPINKKSVLPVRTYKPASHNVFISKENEQPMPGNIRKLIKGPLNPEIIKHVGRVKSETYKTGNTASSNPISATELTFLSDSTASEAVFNVSTGPPGDISLLVSKNAARTNCLQKPK